MFTLQTLDMICMRSNAAFQLIVTGWSFQVADDLWIEEEFIHFERQNRSCKVLNDIR